jgi:hypothetical protein
MVEVRDSASDNFVVEEGELIPVVGESRTSRKETIVPLSERL